MHNSVIEYIKECGGKSLRFLEEVRCSGVKDKDSLENEEAYVFCEGRRLKLG